jgi:hypothetical protein
MIKRRYLHLISLDGSNITLEIHSEKYYPTHVELDVTVVSQFPPSKLLGYSFTVISVDYRPYIVSALKTKTIEIYIAIGEIDIYKGRAYISFGYPSTEFYRVITRESSEIYYKKLYDSLKEEFGKLATLISSCYSEKLDIVDKLHKEYSRIIDKYQEFYMKSIGLASPEVPVLIEGLLSLAPTPTPPTPPTPPPKPSLKERILGFFRKLLRRSR